MQDLTKIDKPFGLLDSDTQTALQEHGGPYEMFTPRGWKEKSSPNFLAINTYRIQSKPITKPSIDWSQVTPDYEWLARDGGGECYLYEEEPTENGYSWVYVPDYLNAKGFVTLDPGTCDWKDSLVQRPSVVVYDLKAIGYETSVDNYFGVYFMWHKTAEGLDYWSDQNQYGLTKEGQEKLNAMKAQWEVEQGR